MFHLSSHQYYENRPLFCVDEENINYTEEELCPEYWLNLSLAEFWSMYEVAYVKKSSKEQIKKSNLIPLLNKKGFIRRRSERAVLRYHLTYDNDEDMARGLLILFYPFRNEYSEIHEQDVKTLLSENKDMIEEKRSVFEKYKLMSDLIASIQSDIEKNEASPEVDDSTEEAEEIETTNVRDIENFNKWAKLQATKDLSKFKDLTISVMLMN